MRTLDKKDSLHPPSSYRPISRTGAISRETSPGKTSPTNLSYNRLYPSSYSQSAGLERTDSSNNSATIPKYTPRNSTSSSESKTDLTSRYKTTGRTTSREDLTTGSQKYITSRFLPKNTVEKSYTAYTRPSTVRTHETSRKNRELLNVIAAQHEQERTSRPVSRCSSVTPEDAASASKSDQSTTESISIPVEEVEEMESVSVVTRSTSPIQSNQPSISRIRRVEVAKLVEKVITRPKKRKPMVDKEMQSDRLDDTSKYSRYGPNSTRAAPTPWSSFLDLKFSSPGDKQKSSKSECDETESVQNETPDDSSDIKRKQSSDSKSKDGSASPKNISRTNSIKNLTRTFSKLDMKNRDSKSKTPPSPPALDKEKSKSKLSLSKAPQGSEKKLPPQIPKNNDSTKSGSLHSLNTLNKDFRKSVLNMSEGKLKKQHSKRSNSVSSAESGSEAQLSEATDVSENLTTCSSFHKSSTFNSKLPQRIQTDNNTTRRSATRSPSSDTSSCGSLAASSSEDDTRIKTKQPESNSKRHQSAASSRTSVILSSADDLPTDKSPKPPLSPRVKTEGQRSEAEAKSFLMRALAPVTNLFKVKHIDSSDKINWMDTSNTDNSMDANNSNQSNNIKEKICINRNDSGERAWWLDEKSDSPKITPEEKIINKTLRSRVDSGEKPWWLDEAAEVPEGVQTYSEENDSRVAYKIRKNDSGVREWWLDSNDENSKNSSSAPPLEPEYLQSHQLRHIDSGERAWWLSSTENIADVSKSDSNQTRNDKPMYKIRPQDSGEKPWWFNDQDEAQNPSDDESDNDMIPLGDRASPEGLETPRDEELQGRTTPYDNVPESHRGVKKQANINLFISRHTDIDDILGGSSQLLSPLMDRIFNYQREYEECEEIDPRQVKIHNSTPQRAVIEPGKL